MATGLNVSDFVRVSVTIQPLAAQYRNFGAGMVVGPSNVIDVAEALRPYTSLDAIAQDFGTNAPEYAGAKLYFSQEPQPAIVYVARWAQTATAGLIHGASLNPTQQLLSTYTAITNGSMKISVDGTLRTLTALDFSGALNLNAVANIVQTALAALSTGATVKWDSVLDRFTVSSGTTGTASSVSYATAHTSGTDVSSLLHLTNADASAPVAGIAAETLVSRIAALADMSGAWYSAQVASATPPSDADYIAAATLVEGLGQSRLFGITITNANTLDPASSADLGSQLKALGLKRTYWQFSRNNPFAAESLFGRAATVDFEASRTTITLAYKNEPGIVPENLTESQFQTIQAKNGNAFVSVNNGTAIVFPGVMANGYYFDEVHGTDWLQNRIQTDVYNLLYESTTKVPQTDAGMDMIRAVIKAACAQGVNNGLIAPGVWTGPPIGPINTGDVLPSGYYVHAPAVATQSDADRAARKSVSFQVLVKLAGAVHTVVIAVQANR